MMGSNLMLDFCPFPDSAPHAEIECELVDPMGEIWGNYEVYIKHKESSTCAAVTGWLTAGCPSSTGSDGPDPSDLGDKG
jgi:hypothetical protein